MEMSGIEPEKFRMRIRRSTIELHPRLISAMTKKILLNQS
jgi:hypothetical protein